MSYPPPAGMVRAFECAHSGLLFPADYYSAWGTKYGAGLGPVPVSEVLDTDYETAPPDPIKQGCTADKVMHSTRCTSAPVHMVYVTPEDFKARAAIVGSEDPGEKKRGEIILANQMKNPKSKVRAYRAAMGGL